MSASEDRSVSLYNPSKKMLIKNYKNLHNYDVSCIDISKDNSKFCTGGGDKILMVMDVLQGKIQFIWGITVSNSLRKTNQKIYRS